MKKILGLMGVAAACGVCCAFPLALPLLGGPAASGMGFAFGWEAAALASLAAVIALLVFQRRQRAKGTACTPVAPKSAGCGCGTICVGGQGRAT